jgi:hypothetical protein
MAILAISLAVLGACACMAAVEALDDRFGGCRGR